MSSFTFIHFLASHLVSFPLPGKNSPVLQHLNRALFVNCAYLETLSSDFRGVRSMVYVEIGQPSKMKSCWFNVRNKVCKEKNGFKCNTQSTCMSTLSKVLLSRKITQGKVNFFRRAEGTANSYPLHLKEWTFHTCPNSFDFCVSGLFPFLSLVLKTLECIQRTGLPRVILFLPIFSPNYPIKWNRCIPAITRSTYSIHKLLHSSSKSIVATKHRACNSSALKSLQYKQTRRTKHEKESVIVGVCLDPSA